MNEAAVGHQCPDCVSEGRRTQRPPRTAFGGRTTGVSGHVTISLVALNCLVAVFSIFSAGTSEALAGKGFGGLLGGITPLLYWGALIAEPTSWVEDDTLIFTAQGVAHGEYYRLLTSMFLHYGLIHLLMNMWALFMLGRLLEATLGPARFLALYLLSGLGGSVAVYIFENPHAPTAGASGAIFGLFSALFIVLRRLGQDSSSVIPILLVNIVITFTIPGISIAGHLGGLITGAIIAAGIAYAPTQRRTLIQVVFCTLVGTVLVLATVTRTVMITGGIAS